MTERQEGFDRQADELLDWIEETLGDIPKAHAAKEIVLQIVLGQSRRKHPADGGGTKAHRR
jgi:hypothetical protein